MPICTSQQNYCDLYLSGSSQLGPPLQLCTGHDFEAVSWGVSNFIVSPGRCVWQSSVCVGGILMYKHQYVLIWNKDSFHWPKLIEM